MNHRMNIGNDMFIAMIIVMYVFDMYLFIEYIFHANEKRLVYSVRKV